MRNSLAKLAKKTMATHTLMDDRFRWWCRQLWPRQTAEHGSDFFGTAIATFKGYLGGNPIPQRVYAMGFEAWGARFAAFVLEPFGDWSKVLEHEAELREIRERVERLNDAIADDKGDSA